MMTFRSSLWNGRGVFVRPRVGIVTRVDDHCVKLNVTPWRLCLSTGSGAEWQPRGSHVHLAADDAAGRFAQLVAHRIAEDSTPGKLPE
jgi:hypothetical protein